MAEVSNRTASLPGVEIDLATFGSGPPLLFLHGEDGLLFNRPFLDALASQHEVVVPTHPGWVAGARTARFRTIDDLAYLYLDLLETFGAPVPVVGASFGGWLALEMATKCSTGISHLALVAPLGIRLASDPTTRAFLDIYAVPQSSVDTALYGDPARKPDLGAMSDDELGVLAQAQEAFTRYAWEPYMHNPCLPDRLHRVTAPVLLVGGAADGLVLSERYLEVIAERVSGRTEIVTIPAAGHRVEEEEPIEVAEKIVKFVSTSEPPA